MTSLPLANRGRAGTQPPTLTELLPVHVGHSGLGGSGRVPCSQGPSPPPGSVKSRPSKPANHGGSWQEGAPRGPAPSPSSLCRPVTCHTAASASRGWMTGRLRTHPHPRSAHPLCRWTKRSGQSPRVLLTLHPAPRPGQRRERGPRAPGKGADAKVPAGFRGRQRGQRGRLEAAGRGQRSGRRRLAPAWTHARRGRGCAAALEEARGLPGFRRDFPRATPDPHPHAHHVPQLSRLLRGSGSSWALSGESLPWGWGDPGTHRPAASRPCGRGTVNWAGGGRNSSVKDTGGGGEGPGTDPGGQSWA